MHWRRPQRIHSLADRRGSAGHSGHEPFTLIMTAEETMVGDDVEREVKPTRSAGVPVFWVRKPGESSAGPEDVPQGPLESVRGWLEQAAPPALTISFERPQALLANLRSTPAALGTLTAGLSKEAWRRAPASTEWCLTEVIGHLRDVEREVNLVRLQKVLSEQNPFLVGETTDVWVKERRYIDQDGPRALADFTAARKEVLGLLDALSAEEWSRPSRHAIFGPTSLQELVGFMAGHDRAHVQQVWKTLPGKS
jgi:hypothetical protein